MTKTFDTSRVGGGTYELEQDSSGNYKLKSVGFDKINKLNLPDLTNLDLPATTPPKDEEKKDVADPFKKLYNQQDGGGDNNQDYSGVMLKSPEVKDVSVREAGDRQRLDPRDDRSSQEIQSLKNAQDIYNKATEALSRPGQFGYSKGYSDPSMQGKTLSEIQSMANEQIMSAREKYATETQYNRPPKTTGLQKVKSKATGLKADIANLASKNVAFNAVKGAAQGLGAFLGAILPEETNSQIHAKTYFNASQVGAQAQRISGNPANDLFAGANRNARELDGYGQKRIDTITKTISKMTPAQKAKSSLPARKEKFEKQQREYREDRAAAKDKASGNTKTNVTGFGKSGFGRDTSGGGGDTGNGCFLKGTLITMLDGTKKPVEQVDLGNEVAVGGKVFAVGRFLNTELYDYKGIKVSGSHMVNEDGTWLRVRDTKHGKSLGDDLNTVYVFGSENRRILIDDILFTDYFEVSEQDQLINNEEDFFNNWKSYGNTIDKHNVNTLNAS